VAKRLYVVQVEFEFAALAESSKEACHFADEALRDMGFLEDCASAKLISFHNFPSSEKPVAMRPDGWEDDALVYGADKDTTLGEAIEQEERLRAEKQGT